MDREDKIDLNAYDIYISQTAEIKALYSYSKTSLSRWRYQPICALGVLPKITRVEMWLIKGNGHSYLQTVSSGRGFLHLPLS